MTDNSQSPVVFPPLFLPDEAATLALGAGLAGILGQTDAMRQNIPDAPRQNTAAAPRLLLLCGPLGSGKTCLMRGLTKALPGGEDAEVASPTFSMCNLYPTRPPVAHVDLYRTGISGQTAQSGLTGLTAQAGMPRQSVADAASRISLSDEILDLMDDGKTLVCIEWAEFFPADCLPESYLALEWQEVPPSTAHENGRSLRVIPVGLPPELLERLGELLSRFSTQPA